MKPNPHMSCRAPIAIAIARRAAARRHAGWAVLPTAFARLRHMPYAQVALIARALELPSHGAIDG